LEISRCSCSLCSSQRAQQGRPEGRPHGAPECSRKTEQRCPPRAPHDREERAPKTCRADERAE